MGLRLPALLAVTALAVAVLAGSASSAASGKVFLDVRFEEPLGNGSWVVTVEYGGGSCRGVVGANVYYLQTRSVSSSLVVLPLYYVLDTVCREALKWLEGLGGGVVRVSVSAPAGFAVRTGMDWRGFGGVGGPYVVGVELFLRYYLFDGVVVADTRLYEVRDDSSVGASVVFWRGARGDAGEALRVLAAVRDAAVEWLGESPRSPVVLVLAPPEEHVYLPPGTAHSIGGVVYVKLGSGRDWLLHTVAHEALHGWFNHGLVYGGFGFQEAVVEFLSMRALWERLPGTYAVVEPYLRGLMEADEQYGVWMRVHAALWLASVKLCGTDLYTAALRRLFEKALVEGPVGPVSLPRLASMIVDSAPPWCREELEDAVGVVLAAAAHPTSTWPFIDAGFVAGLLGRETTVTVTVTVTRTTVSTTTATATVYGGRGGVGVEAVLVLGLLVLVGLGAWVLHCRGKFSG